MYRIAVAHKDSEHPNSASFQWRGTLDSAEDAQAALSAAKAEYPAREYGHQVEQLVDKAEGKSTWEAVS